jgi:hypothetical protein
MIDRRNKISLGFFLSEKKSLDHIARYFHKIKVIRLIRC